MSRFSFLFLLSFVFLFSSCFDIIEEIFINKDGNHKYVVTFDMESLMNDPNMKEIFLGSMRKQPGMVLDENGKINMDSVTNFRDEKGFEGMELSKTLKETAKSHFIIKEAEGIMSVRVEFEFKEISEIGGFFKALENTENVKSDAKAASMFPFGGNYDLDKKSLIRLPVKKLNPALKDDGEFEMMKMMMGASKYITHYYLPGKVKKADFENSTIKGNKVTVTRSTIDAMDRKVKLDGAIKFKK